jgi:two-component system nitrogen regulation response regulator GlnG
MDALPMPGALGSLETCPGDEHRKAPSIEGSDYEPTIVVIDDDPMAPLIVEKTADQLGAKVAAAGCARSGLELARRLRPQVVVLDNYLPDALGIDVLRQLREIDPNALVLFITARGTGATAIEAMKLRAFDYLPKPIDPTKLRVQLERALELRRLMTAPAEDAPELAARFSGADALVGECPRMQAVFKSIGKVALQDSPVLIRGEHGTGKETVARTIHNNSDYHGGPIHKVHCPAFDDERIETQLFGREGATPSESIPGGFELADSGTLVLQEVGALPLPAQSRLLQVLRERRFDRPGRSVSIPVTCRLIATSSQDLEALVRAGRMRPDVYYLLSSFTIFLPPLRQRHGDLPLLIEQLLAQRMHESGRSGPRPRISDGAMHVLSRHTWPGNIDELQSVLDRSLVEAKGNVILSDYLSEALNREPLLEQGAGGDRAHVLTDWEAFADLRIEAGCEDLYAEAINETDRKLLSRVLGHTGGNQAHAARILGITRASLRKKLRALGPAGLAGADAERFGKHDG